MCNRVNYDSSHGRSVQVSQGSGSDGRVWGLGSGVWRTSTLVYTMKQQGNEWGRPCQSGGREGGAERGEAAQYLARVVTRSADVEAALAVLPQLDLENKL